MLSRIMASDIEEAVIIIAAFGVLLILIFPPHTPICLYKQKIVQDTISEKYGIYSSGRWSHKSRCVLEFR